MPTFRLYKGGTKVRECHPIWSKTGKIWSPMGPPLPTCFRQVHINALTVTVVCLCDNITLTFHFYKTIVEQNNRFRFTYCRTEAKQSSKVVAVSVCVCACTCCTVLGRSSHLNPSSVCCTPTITCTSGTIMHMPSIELNR